MGKGHPPRLERLLEEGEILLRNGSLDEAEKRFRRAADLRPDADTLYNHGVALQRLGRHAEAERRLRASLARADSADAWVHLGVSLHEQGRMQEALAGYGRALALAPGLPEAHNNAGNALLALGRAAESLAHFDAALQLRPGDAGVHCNRGNALRALGRHREALEGYAEARRLDPRDPDAHRLAGLVHLSLGEYREGWPLFEWRHRAGAGQASALASPQWDGAADLEGRSVLLHAEQGLGDTVQFARYAPLLAARGAEVTLQVYAPLVRLMQGIPGVRRVIGPDEPRPATDLHCPLASLPHAFRTGFDEVPAPLAYLRIDAAEAAQWRRRLGAGEDRLVGVCWRGNPGYVNDAERSMALADLAPLLDAPGHRFISLQREQTPEEAALAASLPRLSHPALGFEEAARAIAAFDHVIAVDTVWLHWAASLGTPSSALLAFSSHWVWPHARATSPWYPEVRLCRQPTPGDWRGAVAQAIEGLRGG